jgi:hypothetical protein
LKEYCTSQARRNGLDASLRRCQKFYTLEKPIFSWFFAGPLNLALLDLAVGTERDDWSGLKLD